MDKALRTRMLTVLCSGFVELLPKRLETSLKMFSESSQEHGELEFCSWFLLFTAII